MVLILGGFTFIWGWINFNFWYHEPSLFRHLETLLITLNFRDSVAFQLQKEEASLVSGTAWGSPSPNDFEMGVELTFQLVQH